jgi:hypothetical protein
VGRLTPPHTKVRPLGRQPASTTGTALPGHPNRPGGPVVAIHNTRHNRIANDSAPAVMARRWPLVTEKGEPINPRTDWDEWKRLPHAAGVRDGRLHYARHAAVVLLLLGVSERTIISMAVGFESTEKVCPLTRFRVLRTPVRTHPR